MVARVVLVLFGWWCGVDAYKTLVTGRVKRSQLSEGVACSRADAALVEGVHSEVSQPLTKRVLERVPELASWDAWYSHPRLLSNGHVQTLAAAKLRKTRAVRYYRDLVTTEDGGTLAIDLLCGVRRVKSGDAGSKVSASSLFTGGALPGASEAEGFTQFVTETPPLDPSRPMLLLASGLGGGSQDTYVRSMAVTAAERGWQVAVINMRACGASPVTSPRLFSAYRGANDDLRKAVAHLRATRLDGGGRIVDETSMSAHDEKLLAARQRRQKQLAEKRGGSSGPPSTQTSGAPAPSSIGSAGGGNGGKVDLGASGNFSRVQNFGAGGVVGFLVASGATGGGHGAANGAAANGAAANGAAANGGANGAPTPIS